MYSPEERGGGGLKTKKRKTKKTHTLFLRVGNSSTRLPLAGYPYRTIHIASSSSACRRRPGDSATFGAHALPHSIDSASSPSRYQRDHTLPKRESGVGKPGGRYHRQQGHSGKVAGERAPVLRHQPKAEDVQRRPHLLVFFVFVFLTGVEHASARSGKRRRRRW